MSRCLKGHINHVHSVAIDLHGHMLLSGSWGNSSNVSTIKAWNIATGEELGTYEEKESEIVSCMVTIVRSGIAYYGTNMGRIKVLDCSTPKDMFILYDTIAHDKLVSSLASNAQGDLLVSGSYDGKVKLWKIVDRNLSLLHSFEEHQGKKVQSVAMSADGRWIVSGGDDSTIKLWDTAKKEVKASFFGHRRWRNGREISGVAGSVALSVGGQIIVSGGYDAKINLWKVGESEPVWTTNNEHSGHINCLTISADGRFLISGSRDQTVKIWDLHTRTLLQTLPHTGEVFCLALSEDEKTLISASDEVYNNIYVWPINESGIIDNDQHEKTLNIDATASKDMPTSVNVNDPSFGGVGIRKLSSKERRQLVERLLACSIMSDRHSRDAVVQSLDAGISHVISRNAADKIDIMNIVTKCLDFPNGLQELIDAVAFFEGESLPMQQLRVFVQGLQ